jgi:hypothetical protein
MTGQQERAVVKRDLDELMDAFFRAVSFAQGERPHYDEIYRLFIENGLLIKNSMAVPEIANVAQFIEPRQAIIRSGELVSFREIELSEVTEIFGNVAQRFSAYAKSGITNGVSFAARGMIATQFIRTPAGWKMSAMAWDDERPGLTLPAHAPAAESVPSV